MTDSIQSSAHGAFTIPSLDGLRAIAVMIVFIGHCASVPGLWPGHVGVTIFFFLSGYLITTLLRREYSKTDNISLKNFYLRRLLRITPPALFSIALCVAVGAAGILPANMNGWGILAEVLNYTNYYLAYVNGHDGLPPESSMLWSLAVEEHFYLIFPAALILLLGRKLTYRQIGYFLLFAAAIAPFWRLYLHLQGANFYRLYTSTDTRYDGLLVGAAMALLWNPALGDKAPLNLTSDLIVKWITPSALIVFAAFSIFPDPHRLTVVDSILYICLIPVFWTIIAHPRGWIGKILNTQWIMRIGVLSFSLYLIHRLFLGLCSEYIHVKPLADASALVLSLVAAQGMYTFIEKPAGRIRKRLEQRAMSRQSLIKSISTKSNLEESR